MPSASRPCATLDCQRRPVPGSATCSSRRSGWCSTKKGAEVILNNVGEEPATYRVSVEFRRMTEAGELVDVTTPSAADKAAEDMIIYAPRKVTLAPREPQAIRIAARPAAGLPDGEYRIHMLFRAIPPATPVAETSNDQVKGVQFKLTPIYGVIDLGHRPATTSRRPAVSLTPNSSAKATARLSAST